MEQLTFKLFKTKGVFSTYVELSPIKPMTEKLQPVFNYTCPSISIASWNCASDSMFAAEKAVKMMTILHSSKPQPQIILLQQVSELFLNTLLSKKSTFAKENRWAIAHTVDGVKAGNAVLINTRDVCLLSSDRLKLPTDSVADAIIFKVKGQQASKFEDLPEVQFVNVQLEIPEDGMSLRQTQMEYIQNFVQGPFSVLSGDLSLHNPEENYFPERFVYEDSWRRLKKPETSTTISKLGKASSCISRRQRVLIKCQKIEDKLKIYPLKMETLGGKPFNVSGVKVFVSEHMGILCTLSFK